MKRLILKVFSIISIIMLFLTFHKIYGFEFGFGVKSFVKKVIEKGQQEGKIKKEEGEGEGGEKYYDVEWVKYLDKNNSEADSGTNLAIDKSGNIYVSGTYIDSSVSKNYIVLAKFSPTAGKKQWEKNIEGDASDICWGVAVDPSGEYVYITGNTFGDYFDGVLCRGNGDIFLTKYDSNGNKLWTKVFGVDGSYEAGYNITVDNSGNVYIVGATNGSFDTGEHQGGFDGFLAKLDSNGNILWIKQIGTSKDEECWGVGTDSSGNVYVTVISSSSQGLGGLLIKYDSEGGKIWEKTFEKEGPLDLTVDSSGNIYVTGSWLDVSALKIFLAKYDTSGDQQWIKYNIVPGCVGLGVAVDITGVYVTGSAWPVPTKKFVTIPTPGVTLVLAKYFLDGKEQWTTMEGGYCGLGIRVDSSSNIYITGSTTTTGSNSDIFLMKLRAK